MNDSKALAAKTDYGREQIDLIKRTIAPDLDDNELALFVEVCKRTDLDPFRKEIYVQKRRIRGRNGEPDTFRLVFITAIDGYRKRAANTGLYDGQLGPFWCALDGQWRDVWLDKMPPSAAKVGVRRKGCTEPFWGVARYASYVQTVPAWEGNRIVGHKPVEMWEKMPDNQLAKCAEALALRKAFPNELGELRTHDEMEQADNVVAPPFDPGQLLPEAAPAKTWDAAVFELSDRIKKATKAGEMNALAAELDAASRAGLPAPLYAALRNLFDERMRKAKEAKAKRSTPEQDYQPTDEEIAALERGEGP